MKARITINEITAVLIFSILAVIMLFIFTPLQERFCSYLDLEIQASIKGTAQVFYDLGNGFIEKDSASFITEQSDRPVPYHIRIPFGRLRAVRLDPIDRPSAVHISDIKISVPGQKSIIIPSSRLNPENDIVFHKDIKGYRIITADAGDPFLSAVLDTPLDLRPDINFILPEMLSWFFIISAVSLFLFYSLRSVFYRCHCFFYQHPSALILLMSVLAVVLSAFPVVFSQRSFVSPGCGACLLYDDRPALPDYNETRISCPPGSDVGAMMWQHLPYSVIQKRALKEHFELPLYNRYNSCGTSLIGQGQSMLGDPLHALVMLFNDTAVSWDIKFLLAKFLFTFGIGMLVFVSLRHLPASLLMVFSSAFTGFFVFRFNHPAFFSLCYSPWILYFWFKFTEAASKKSIRSSITGLFAASWLLITSGTVKEAYILLLLLNLAGLTVFLLSGKERLKPQRFLPLILIFIIFMLSSSFIWITFIRTLGQSSTDYDAPSALQLPLSSLAGFFDEIFLRQIHPLSWVYNPAVNFFILMGFLYSLTGFRDLIKRDKIYKGVFLSALLPFSLVFGIIPAGLIVKIPFIRNIHHINNTFSCVLVIYIILLSSYGIKALWKSPRDSFLRRYIFTLSGFVLLLVLYFTGTKTAGESAFFCINLVLLFFAFVFCPPALRKISLKRPLMLLLLIICMIIFHYRSGMHYHGIFDDHLMIPGLRTDLLAPSKAIDYIRDDRSAPHRTAGFGRILFSGFNGVYGIESIGGVDGLRNRYYADFIDSSGIKINGRIIITVIEEGSLEELKPVYDMLNVKYYLQDPSSGTVNGLKLLNQSDLDVYSSTSVWPRAFFTSACSLYSEPREFIDMIKKGDGRPFSAVQAGSDSPAAFPGISEGQKDRIIVPAHDYKLTNNKTSFYINAPRKGIAVLSETYYKGDFIARVNGSPARYFRVNHAFKGIFIEKPGKYHIEFIYRPRYFTFLLIISGIAFLMLILWSW